MILLLVNARQATGRDELAVEAAEAFELRPRPAPWQAGGTVVVAIAVTLGAAELLIRTAARRPEASVLVLTHLATIAFVAPLSVPGQRLPYQRRLPYERRV